ncbi:hypothetical protein JCM10914A_36660 [Paenibacillus sp. JCM 10914]|uniref:hypothetical protein n=1 Tax=Paenibacillus sp. JCM 10914 TaxID=1236974 RepID=UPI0003CCA149|nr:hypothetical protein [Paenibacillus sp. JCM 10914]GAE04337.1 hypothetical protein JCM10914_378 [Paenibacillus sp. JCM 10914]
MFSLIFYVLILSLNVLIILLGLYVYNDPDNEWIRMFNGIPDHVEQDDVELSQIKFRAVIAIMGATIMGLFTVLQSFVHLLG